MNTMNEKDGIFNLWAFGDCHVGSDKRSERDSLSDSLRQVESENGFDWDIGVDVGDMSGGQKVPEDEEGEEIVKQFSVMKKHIREQIYNLSGNHDRSGIDEPPAWWWRKWLDPMGKNTEFSQVDNSLRPYPVTGTWERYSFQVGNILFLMMSDINAPHQTIGRGDLGGNPAGVVSRETFEWWRTMVESNQDKIIISAHHYMLKETTVASGEWEGMRKDENGEWTSHYHGLKPQGAPKGASYLYFLDEQEDAQAFEKYLEAHPGAIDLWLGGHTHTDPDDTYGGKSHVETKWGTHFINVSAITKHHAGWSPMSRLLSFIENDDQLRVRCYLHTDDFAPSGWYEEDERILKLTKPFKLECEDEQG